MVDQQLLIEEAKKIVSQEDVKYVVGYKKGTYGFTVSPSYAYSPEYVENFIFNPLCTKNLTVYPMLEEKLPLGRDEKEDTRKIVAKRMPWTVCSDYNGIRTLMADEELEWQITETALYRI